MWRLCLGIGLCLVLGLVVQAQTETVVPSLDSLFSDHVTLKTVAPVVDAVHRELHVFSKGQWKTIPYPADFMTVSTSVREYEDLHKDRERSLVDAPAIFTYEGVMFLTEGLKDTYQGARWVIDPKVGTLTPFQSQCPVDHKAPDVPGIWPLRVGWIRVNTNDETYFCNTVTGKRTRGLPFSDEWDSPISSPDGRYLFLTKTASWDEYGNYLYAPTQLYSIDLETGALVSLGDEVLAMADYQDSLGWITPTVFGYRTRDMPEWSTVTYYTVKMGVRDSFQAAIAKTRLDPRAVDDPPSFENQSQELNDGPSSGPCYLEVFDLTTYTTTTYPTATLCDYGVIIPDGTGDRLYRAMYPEAGLVRYNHITGERRNIFVGEVEGLGSVSPRGTYARLGLGASGLVDQVQDPNNDPFEYTGDWPLVIRLSDGTFLGYVPYDAVWLSDQHLWYDNTLYTITSHGVTKMAMPADVDMLLSLPETGHLIVRTKGGGYGLYSLFERRLTPLFTYDGPYRVRISSSGLNAFHVEFFEDLGVTPASYGLYSERALRLAWEMDFSVH